MNEKAKAFIDNFYGAKERLLTPLRQDEIEDILKRANDVASHYNFDTYFSGDYLDEIKIEVSLPKKCIDGVVYIYQCEFTLYKYPKLYSIEFVTRIDVEKDNEEIRLFAQSDKPFDSILALYSGELSKMLAVEGWEYASVEELRTPVYVDGKYNYTSRLIGHNLYPYIPEEYDLDYDEDEDEGAEINEKDIETQSYVAQYDDKRLELLDFLKINPNDLLIKNNKLTLEMLVNEIKKNSPCKDSLAIEVCDEKFKISIEFFDDVCKNTGVRLRSEIYFSYRYNIYTFMHFMSASNPLGETYRKELCGVSILPDQGTIQYQFYEWLEAYLVRHQFQSVDYIDLSLKAYDYNPVTHDLTSFVIKDILGY